MAGEGLSRPAARDLTAHSNYGAPPHLPFLALGAMEGVVSIVHCCKLPSVGAELN